LAGVVSFTLYTFKLPSMANNALFGVVFAPLLKWRGFPNTKICGNNYA